MVVLRMGQVQAWRNIQSAWSWARLFDDVDVVTSAQIAAEVEHRLFSEGCSRSTEFHRWPHFHGKIQCGFWKAVCIVDRLATSEWRWTPAPGSLWATKAVRSKVSGRTAASLVSWSSGIASASAAAVACASIRGFRKCSPQGAPQILAIITVPVWRRS